MIETIGSVLLASCALPEALRAFKMKNCSVGWAMLLMWLIGELCLIVFAINTKQYILLINYFANVAFVLVMVYYKLFPKLEDL